MFSLGFLLFAIICSFHAFFLSSITRAISIVGTSSILLLFLSLSNSHSFGHFESFQRNSSRISGVCDLVGDILVGFLETNYFRILSHDSECNEKTERKEKKREELSTDFFSLHPTEC
jgi:hypothetical protein